MAMDQKVRWPFKPYELIKAVRRINEEGVKKIEIEVETFQPNLILNQVRSRKDIEIGFSIRSACQDVPGSIIWAMSSMTRWAICPAEEALVLRMLTPEQPNA
jgi:hypothetical protein